MGSDAGIHPGSFPHEVWSRGRSQTRDPGLRMQPTRLLRMNTASRYPDDRNIAAKVVFSLPFPIMSPRPHRLQPLSNNHRPMPFRWTVTPEQARRTLLQVLGRVFPKPQQVSGLLAMGKVRLEGRICRDGRRRLRAGDRIEVATGEPRNKNERRTAEPSPSKRPEKHPARGATRRSAAAALKERGIVLRHLDDHLLVVDKPAGLTTVRHRDEIEAQGPKARRFLPATLVDLVQAALPGPRIRAVHRLDRDTSGLVVLARTAAAETALGKQFRKHAVGRRYLALVRGQARTETITTHLVKDRGDGRRGSSSTGEGQQAVTHVRLLETLGPCCLVECRLETGRTHQVRIHLGERGTPLCGERIYDRPLHGRPLPDPTAIDRPALHAASLELTHPTTEENLAFDSLLPGDMAALIARLRKQ